MQLRKSTNALNSTDRNRNRLLIIYQFIALCKQLQKNPPQGLLWRTFIIMTNEEYIQGSTQIVRKVVDFFDVKVFLSF